MQRAAEPRIIARHGQRNSWCLGFLSVNSILVMSNDEVDRRVKRDEFSQMSAMRNDSVTRFGFQKIGRHWPMKMDDVS